MSGIGFLRQSRNDRINEVRLAGYIGGNVTILLDLGRLNYSSNRMFSPILPHRL